MAMESWGNKEEKGMKQEKNTLEEMENDIQEDKFVDISTKRFIFYFYFCM